MALDICDTFEKKLVIIGRSSGATGAAFTDYLMETLQDPALERRWREYQEQAGGIPADSVTAPLQCVP